jgi:hypothetical protein
MGEFIYPEEQRTGLVIVCEHDGTLFCGAVRGHLY